MKRNGKVFSVLMIAAFSFLLLLAPNASSQEMMVIQHDLSMLGVWANPSPLVCESRVCAQFLATGYYDHRLSSGDITIDFSYSYNDGGWNEIGTIPVTWEPNEVFVSHVVWPRDFDSSPNNCIDFSPDLSSGTYRFRAEVKYPAGYTDEYPSDNSRTSALYDSICQRRVRINPCPIRSGGFCTIRDWLDSIITAEIYCKDNPKVCGGGIDVPGGNPCKPPLCDGFIEVGSFCPKCPTHEGQIEILVDTSINHFEYAITDSKGKQVAGMHPLKKPVRDGAVTYNNSILFKMQPGENYMLRYRPTAETNIDATLSMPFRARTLTDTGRK